MVSFSGINLILLSIPNHRQNMAAAESLRSEAGRSFAVTWSCAGKTVRSKNKCEKCCEIPDKDYLLCVIEKIHHELLIAACLKALPAPEYFCYL